MFECEAMNPSLQHSGCTDVLRMARQATGRALHAPCRWGWRLRALQRVLLVEVPAEPFGHTFLCVQLVGCATSLPVTPGHAGLRDSFVFLLESCSALVVAPLQEVALMNDRAGFLFQRNPGLMWAFCGHHCISILL